MQISKYEGFYANLIEKNEQFQAKFQLLMLISPFHKIQKSNDKHQSTV
jgi:hypothetical protein